jgi:hypothetical protein
MNKFLKQIVFGSFIFIVVNTIIAVKYEYPNYMAIKNKTHRNYLKWNDIHSEIGTYDMVVVGTSRSYAAFNPLILDSTLNVNSYNMGTSSQDIAETYYTLEEIFEYQKPKYVILDLFFESSDDSHDYYQIFSNSSFFKSVNRRFNLIYKGYGSTGMINFIIPIVKFKNYIKQDFTALFKNNKPQREEINWMKGYLSDSLVVTSSKIDDFGPISNFENSTFSTVRFNTYFKKINDLVISNGSKLICVRAPYPPTRLKLTQIDDEGNFFQTYTFKNNIPYLDINRINNYSNIYEDQDFADYHHANYQGAQKATIHLSDFIKSLQN